MSSFDPESLERYPTEPGVYLMKQSSGEVLYVGKAKNLRSRLKQYFALGRDSRPMVPWLVELVDAIDIIVVPSETEALLLENVLIKQHQPRFNVLLKDGKTFISLSVNIDHPWPRVTLVRNQPFKTPTSKSLTFGPYPHAVGARQTHDLMGKLFPLRQCSDEELSRRRRPCILYDMRRCLAPCVHKCSSDEYRRFVDDAIAFLRGKSEGVMERLKGEIQKASDLLEFEQAGALLKLLHQVERVTHADEIVAKDTGGNVDVVGLYRQGFDVMIVHLYFRQGKLIGSDHYSFSQVIASDEELIGSFMLQYYEKAPIRPDEVVVGAYLAGGLEEVLQLKVTCPSSGDRQKMVDIAEHNARILFEQEHRDEELVEKMLLDLQETLHLSRYPRHIECFDISHVSGTDLVAAMVVFTDGKYDRQKGRLFNIRSVQQGDDYGALREVLTRRLTRCVKDNIVPDLIIVDGGRGQLNVALEVAASLNIVTVDIIGVTKESGKHTKGVTQETVCTPGCATPVALHPHSPLLLLLQRIRDEAHRRAVGFHRKRREKRLLSSRLLTIPGIGPVRQKRLLQTFGSLKRVLEASPADLLAVPGMTLKDVEQIQLFAASWR